MSVQPAGSKVISQVPTPTSAPSDTSTRLRGRWLLLARVGWFIAVGVVVGLYALSIPLQAHALQTPCTDICQYEQLTAAQMQELHQLGLSLNFYIAYELALNTIFFLVFVAVGVLIFWRKSNDWFGIYVALTLLLFGISFSNPLLVIAKQYPTFSLPLLAMNALGGTLIGIFFYLFPDGRFVPRWTRWLIPLVIARELAYVFAPESPVLLLFPIELGTFVLAQIYRYRRSSNAVERQQTKWFVYGASVGILGFVALIVSVSSLSENGQPTSVLLDLIGGTALYFFILLIPLSIMMAILRYRLWDIDILINRTLVYVPLTAILAGIFAASITVTQKFFIAVTGQTSDAATVFTTLIVVAVFEPLKTGLQRLVDKRFKEPPDPTKELHAIRDQANAILQVIDLEPSLRHLLDAAVRVFDANGGAVFVQQNGQARVAYTSGQWNGVFALRVPIEGNGGQLGELALGARRNGAEYSEQDRTALQETVAPVARALALTRQMNGARQ